MSGHQCRRRHAAAGFGLAELMLAMGLGLVVSAAMLQSLLVDSRSGQRLVARLQQRQLQQRALALVAADLRQANQLSRTPELEQHGCNLAGRQAVLHLRSAAGPISYSVGAAPSGLWHGQVLMRCGPAYGLDGQLSTGGVSQNRVVLDGLGSTGNTGSTGADCPADGVPLGNPQARGFSACLSGDGGSLALRLQSAQGPASQSRLEWSGDRPSQLAGIPTDAAPHP